MLQRGEKPVLTLKELSALTATGNRPSVAVFVERCQLHVGILFEGAGPMASHHRRLPWCIRVLPKRFRNFFLWSLQNSDGPAAKLVTERVLARLSSQGSTGRGLARPLSVCQKKNFGLARLNARA